MEPITNEVKARIFGAYWGAAVIVPDLVTFEKRGIQMLYGHALQNDTAHYVNWEGCKLLLKKFSNLSDEDALEIAKIILPFPFQKMKRGWIVDRKNIAGYDYITIKNPKNNYQVEIDCLEIQFSLYSYANDNLGEGITDESHMHTTHCLDYLRLRSYNIGYGPYTPGQLIEAGIVEEIKN